MALARIHNIRWWGQVVLAGLVSITLALIWWGAYQSVRSDRATRVAQTEVKLRGTSLIFEEQLRRQLLALDQTLRIVRKLWERDRSGFDLSSLASEIVASSGLTQQMFIADAQGMIRASTTRELVGGDISSRQFYKSAAALRDDNDRLLIEVAPERTVTGRRQLDLARRLTDQDGSFAGVVVAAYDPNELLDLYAKSEVGPRGLVAVITVPEGAIRAIAGPQSLRADRSFGGSAMLQAMLSNPQVFWIGPSPTDGIERIHAFQPVAGRGLAVIIGFEKDAALARALPWEYQAFTFAGCTTGALLLAIFLLIRRSRAARAQEEQFARDRAVLTAANVELAAARVEAQAKSTQLEAALTGMSDGIMMIDSELRLIEWNSHFPEFTGLPQEMLRVGLPMSEILRRQAEGGEFGQVDVETEVARRMALLRSGGSTGVIERRRPGGRVMELRRSMIPGGGFVTVYTDVTARRQAEDRARQAEKLAAIGRFTAGIAHDFNNLLSSIIGSADLLHRRLSSQDPHRRMVDRILATAEKGDALVRQLLDSTRTQPLNPTLVDMNIVVLQSLDLLRSTMGSTIDIETDLTPGLWLVLVDKPQLERAIVNLAVNARDAMQDGGALKIATMNLPQDGQGEFRDLEAGDYVVLSISDTGTGMSEEVLQSASEPFFTTKPVGKGSGLGLSQVQSFAQQSAGAVRITSRVNVGTTVSIFIRRGDDSSSQQPQDPSSLPQSAELVSSPPAEVIEPTEPLRVLFVVNDDEFRETLYAMLKTAGYEPISAASGAEALQAIESGAATEALLVDQTLSDMKGLALAAAARERLPALPVVIMTARPATEVFEDASVLQKPFLIDALSATLKRALHNSRQA
jgi:signal transduction histidine kinase